MSAPVFISYSTKDLAFANEVRDALAVVSVNAFLADVSLPPAARLSEIREAIRVSELFVLIWSMNASRSHWVRDEVGAAWGTNKRVLPVMLAKAAPLPPSLADVKYIPAYENRVAAVLQVQKIAKAFQTLRAEQARPTSGLEGGAAAGAAIGVVMAPVVLPVIVVGALAHLSGWWDDEPSPRPPEQSEESRLLAGGPNALALFDI